MRPPVGVSSLSADVVGVGGLLTAFVVWQTQLQQAVARKVPHLVSGPITGIVKLNLCVLARTCFDSFHIRYIHSSLLDKYMYQRVAC